MRRRWFGHPVQLAMRFTMGNEGMETQTHNGRDDDSRILGLLSREFLVFSLGIAGHVFCSFGWHCPCRIRATGSILDINSSCMMVCFGR